MTDRRYAVSTRTSVADESVGFECGADEHDLDGAIAKMLGKRKAGEIVTVSDNVTGERVAVGADGRRVVR